MQILKRPQTCSWLWCVGTAVGIVSRVVGFVEEISDDTLLPDTSRKDCRDGVDSLDMSPNPELATCEPNTFDDENRSALLPISCCGVCVCTCVTAPRTAYLFADSRVDCWMTGYGRCSPGTPRTSDDPPSLATIGDCITRLFDDSEDQGLGVAPFDTGIVIETPLQSTAPSLLDD